MAINGGYPDVKKPVLDTEVINGTYPGEDVPPFDPIASINKAVNEKSDAELEEFRKMFGLGHQVLCDEPIPSNPTDDSVPVNSLDDIRNNTKQDNGYNYDDYGLGF